MSLLAAIDDYTIEQGVKFSRLYFYEDESGLPVDLTGYEAKLQYRTYFGATVIIELTHLAGLTLGGNNGSIQVDLTATETTAMIKNRFKYDLELYPAAVAADAIRLVQGVISLSKEVTV